MPWYWQIKEGGEVSLIEFQISAVLINIVLCGCLFIICTCFAADTCSNWNESTFAAACEIACPVLLHSLPDEDWGGNCSHARKCSNTDNCTDDLHKTITVAGRSFSLLNLIRLSQYVAGRTSFADLNWSSICKERMFFCFFFMWLPTTLGKSVP